MRSRMIVMLVAALGLTGCGTSGSGDRATTGRTSVATAPTSSDSAGAATAPPESTTVVMTSVPETEPSQLVYVTLGNSLLFSPFPGVMGLYRTRLEERLGVSVVTRDHTQGGQTVRDFLAALRHDETLRADLAEADVVIMLVPNDEWDEPATLAMSDDPSACGGDDDLQCFRDAVAGWESSVDEVFAELATVVDLSTTLVRIFDCYLFTPGDADAAAVERLGPLWQEAQMHLAATAADYGLPVARVFDDFMGADGATPPETAGLVSYDGLHPTRAGAERITELLVDLGFEPIG